MVSWSLLPVYGDAWTACRIFAGCEGVRWDGDGYYVKVGGGWEEKGCKVVWKAFRETFPKS